MIAISKYFHLFILSIDSMVIGAGSGIFAAAAFDVTILVPLITTLLIPFLKEFGDKVVIPYFRKKFKIKDDGA